MSELKTLKELVGKKHTLCPQGHTNIGGCSPVYCAHPDRPSTVVLVWELRAEAIKWLKSVELDSHKGDSHIREWIQHFFNISEGDLK